jgi:hypothetical protein
MNSIGSATILRRAADGWDEFPVTVGWLTAVEDWHFLRDWRRSLRRDTTVAARDSYEYAGLACKRWRFLHGQALTPGSLPEMRATLQRDPALELGFTVALFSRDQPDTVLGIAFARRTWANNLILEFLAGAPENSTAIKGTGSLLMQTLARIAGIIRCSELWGECTALSQGFYILTKRRTGSGVARNQEPEAITDRFQFTSEELRALLADSSVRLK